MAIPKVHLVVHTAAPMMSSSFTKPKLIKKFVNPSLNGPSTVKKVSTFVTGIVVVHVTLLLSFV